MPRVKSIPRRRPRAGRWLQAARRGLRRLTIVGVLVGIGTGAYQLWHANVLASALAAATSLHDRVYAATARLGLRVHEITVVGRSETSGASVLAALGVTRDAPILGFDPAAAKQALEELPWVKRAVVERRLPNVIHVDLVERRPLALWQKDGQLVVIDHDGEVIRGLGVERFADMVVLVGDDAPAQARVLTAVLASEPALRARVDAAIRVAGRRWNIRLDNGIEILLPELNPAAAWTRLAALEKRSNVLDGSARVVDLRLPDRFIVRARDGGPAAPADPPPRPLRPQRPRQI